MTVVAERDSEETFVGVGPRADTEKLTVDYPATGSTTPQAWSAAEPDPEVLPQSWGQAWSAAAVFLLVGVVIAMTVAGWALLHSERGSGPQMPLPAAALPPISSAPIAPPPPPPPPVEAHGWVAIAVSQRAVTHKVRTGTGVYLGGQDTGATQQEADDGAIQACAKYTGNTDCVVVRDVYHGCVAYMIDMETAAYAGATASNDRAAIDDAARAVGDPNARGASACSSHAGQNN